MEGPRACRPDELEGLRQLVNKVFRSGGESCMFAEFPTLFTPENCERLRVFVDGGCPVSSINYVARQVVIYGNVLTVGSLGAVSTYEEYRGQGLATKLLEDTFAQMRREEVDVVLISGQRGLYQRAGCAIGGHEVRFSLDRAALERVSLPNGLTIAEATDDDIPALIALHQQEPARFVRSPWDWRQFLKVCRLTMRGVEPPFGVRRCWIVSRNRHPLVYVVLSFGRDRQSPGAGIVECGGARWAVGAACRLLAERFDLRAVGGRVLPEDGEALELLDMLGVATELHLLGGHRLSVLHSNILRRFCPWLAERAGPEIAEAMELARDGGTWSLVLGKRRVAVGDLEALNAALFGDTACDLSGDPETVAVWKQALPLPWLLPGMNYI